jgi:hypothetical protein
MILPRLPNLLMFVVRWVLPEHSLHRLCMPPCQSAPQRLELCCASCTSRAVFCGHAWMNLAEAHRVQGNLNAALAAAREAFGLCQRAADQMMVAHARYSLARVS